MFHLYFTFLPMYMMVYSQMTGSNLKRDSTVILATLANSMNQLVAGLHSTMVEQQLTKDDLEATKIRLQEQEQHSSFMNRTLITTLTELQSTKDDLKATKTELQNTKTSLQEQEQNSSSMYRTLKTTLTELQSTKDDIVATKARLQALQTELAVKNKNVAFSVYIKSQKQSGSNLPVKFDGVDYKAGNGYNTTTGKFTAPVSGTYTFSAVVMIHMTSGATYMQIIQAGSSVSAGYGHFPGDYMTIPVSVTIQLRQGEQVWIVSSGDVTLSSTYHPCHFLGTLLYTD